MSKKIQMVSLVPGLFVKALLLCTLLLAGALPASFASAENPGRVKITNNAAIDIRSLSASDVDIKIDGKLEESIWPTLPAYDEFFVIDPDTLKPSTSVTLVRLFHTERGLYVGIDMEQPEGTLVSRFSGRDVRALNRDSINITLDTSGEGRYGFWFGVNLGGSIQDGTVLPERKFSSDWDGPWRSATAVTKKGWSAEFFIPWGTVSMPATGAERAMGLYMSRKVAYRDERWGWPALPSTKPVFMSALQPMKMREVQPRQQYNIYPFAAVTGDNIGNDVGYRVGADLFWRPSTNFQVNATINPDFGGVESDDVVINLSAVENFFPEKRLFFQEGQEIFVASPRAAINRNGVGSGGDPYTMVNSRRIGGRARAPDNPDGLNINQRQLIQPAELIGAAKISGQSGRIRYGFLGAMEKQTKFDARIGGPGGLTLDENLHTQGSDYAIARVLFEDNAGGAYRALGVLATAVLHDQGDALAQGIDGHYLSPKGGLSIDSQVFTSDIDGEKRGFGGFIDFEVTPKRGRRYRLGIEHMDRNIDINDLGFLGRNDRTRVRASHIRTTSAPRLGRNNQFDVRGFIDKNADDEYLGAGIFISDRITFKNFSNLTLRVGHFTPGFDDLNSFGNGSYRVSQRSSGSLRYRTNSSKRLAYEIGIGLDEEALGGDSYSVNAGITWRPLDQLNVELSVRHRDRQGWLLHQEDNNFTTFKATQWQPKLGIEYYFSARQQLRLSAQWVAIKAREDEFFAIPNAPDSLIPTSKPAGASDSFALSDMVIQARYRWELAPLSDLFIVYTRTSDVGFALRDENFGNLLDRSWDQPIVDQLVVKLRYRFGG